MRLITDEEMGRRVRDARLALKLTQKQVAKRLRISQSRVSYIERGVSQASRAEMKALARHLRLSIESLVFEESADLAAS